VKIEPKFLPVAIAIALLLPQPISPNLAHASQPTELSLADRITYQRAIEEVYWRHRIWPAESPEPKPSLDHTVCYAELRKKVEDYLRNSQALQDFWQQPLSAEQLQAEMDRMAQHTKQPEVLRELFQALNNDPFVIAECLARPALAERVATNLYAHDERLHGELKRAADADLQTHGSVEQIKRSSGEYTEIEFVRRNHADSAAATRRDAAVVVSDAEWKETLEKLALIFAVAKTRNPGLGRTATVDDPLAGISMGVFSSLQEDGGRYYATALISKTEERVRLATVEWRKESIESWRDRAEPQISNVFAVPSANYTLPTISAAASECIDNTWKPTAAAPTARDFHTAVWTGTEMIVWGGGSQGVNTGGRYNPSTDTWAATSLRNAPTARYSHTAVWTGTEMIVWGGRDGNARDLRTGGRYNPTSDIWKPASTTGAPHGRESHTAVWTGSEMVVWGGFYYGSGFNPVQLNTGGRYNPSTNTWIATSITSAPAARSDHTAIWTGSEMIVWGGGLNAGGRYNPGANSWASTSTTNAPSARSGHTAVWTGTQMIVWGGEDNIGPVKTGAKYNPATNRWISISVSNSPTARFGHKAVWTGNRMIIWGGAAIPNIYFNSGGIYNPSTNTWINPSLTNAPSARSAHTAIWTGTQMIVWGGFSLDSGARDDGAKYNPKTDIWMPISTPAGRAAHSAIWTGTEMIIWGGIDSADFNTGGSYSPSTDAWIATNTIGAPTSRWDHTAVWTGSEMMVWGGLHFDGTNFTVLNTGGRYNPASNTWTPTTITNAPTARTGHVALWTGSEMIVWGGGDGVSTFNNGRRYNPTTDSWKGISTVNAPTPRAGFTGIWTGNRMIIWGGSYYDPGSGYHYLNTGASFNPSTNTWAPTTTTNAPPGQDSHTAVWSGNEMIVWGGFYQLSYLNSGARYNPATNTWVPTSVINAPTARYLHTAVWTGSEMIVWGGTNDSFDFNTGGRYNPSDDSWRATSTSNAPSPRRFHTAIWTGDQMIIWGGAGNTGGRYCAQPPN
jgi:N-acetylneuraminic acid mutarotase